MVRRIHSRVARSGGKRCKVRLSENIRRRHAISERTRSSREEEDAVLYGVGDQQAKIPKKRQSVGGRHGSRGRIGDLVGKAALAENKIRRRRPAGWRTASGSAGPGCCPNRRQRGSPRELSSQPGRPEKTRLGRLVRIVGRVVIQRANEVRLSDDDICAIARHGPYADRCIRARGCYRCPQHTGAGDSR